MNTIQEKKEEEELISPVKFKRPFAYLRVSSSDQSLERQRRLIKPYNIAEEDIFEEKQSGKNLDRPELKRLMSILRKGDILYIESYSRISRSIIDFFSIIQQLEKKDVELFSIKENVYVNNSPSGRMFRNMLMTFAEYEREVIRDRQLDGIRIAKEKGLYKGKQRVRLPDNFKECLEKYNNRENDYRMKDFQKETGIKSGTLFRIMKEFKLNKVHPDRYIPLKKKKN